MKSRAMVYLVLLFVAIAIGAVMLLLGFGLLTFTTSTLPTGQGTATFVFYPTQNGTDKLVPMQNGVPYYVLFTSTGPGGGGTWIPFDEFKFVSFQFYLNKKLISSLPASGTVVPLSTLENGTAIWGPSQESYISGQYSSTPTSNLQAYPFYSVPITTTGLSGSSVNLTVNVTEECINSSGQVVSCTTLYSYMAANPVSTVLTATIPLTGATTTSTTTSTVLMTTSSTTATPSNMNSSTTTISSNSVLTENSALTTAKTTSTTTVMASSSGSINPISSITSEVYGFFEWLFSL